MLEELEELKLLLEDSEELDLLEELLELLELNDSELCEELLLELC